VLTLLLGSASILHHKLSVKIERTLHPTYLIVCFWGAIVLAYFGNDRVNSAVGFRFYFAP
jgi:hypothetical protein